jgi:hypothetical protein
MSRNENSAGAEFVNACPICQATLAPRLFHVERCSIGFLRAREVVDAMTKPLGMTGGSSSRCTNVHRLIKGSFGAKLRVKRLTRLLWGWPT